MNDVISLIVPVYNGDKWLEKFFRQFEKQTYQRIELILVDDGSSDQTPNLVDKYAKNKRNVFAYHKSNGGPSAARNYGLSKASGNFIVFADVDDVIKPDYIEYLYMLLCKYHADIAFCSYVKIVESQKNVRSQIIESPEELVLDQGEAIKYFCYRRKLTGYSYLKLIKSEIAKSVLFYEDIVYGEDFIFTYELLKKCKKVVYGNEVQYLYVQYKNSSTHRNRDNTEKYWVAWERHMGFLEDVKNHYPGAYKGAIAKCYILAINNTTRIYDRNRDKQILRQYYQFIEENAKTVCMDKEAKKINRTLGFLGCISVKGVCALSKMFFIIQERFHVTFKRTI